MLERRIALFLSLPLASLDRTALTARIRGIGRADVNTTKDSSS
jgi:hypothetical protein